MSSDRKDHADRRRRDRAVRNSTTVHGGTFVGSTIGTGRVDSHAEVHVQHVGPPADDPAAVAELRRLLERAREQIADAVEDDEKRVVLGYEIRMLAEDLAATEPAEPVAGRWDRIRGMLGPLATAGTALAQLATEITGLVQALFPAR